jgi:hypothetical protein
MTEITSTDLRRWQWAAVSVLQELITEAADLTPIRWSVGATAHLQGTPGSGTHTERRAWLEAWAAHLGIELKTRESGGAITRQGHTERTAPNGKAVRIQLYDRALTDH